MPEFVQLRTSDGQLTKVEFDVIALSGTIKQMLAMCENEGATVELQSIVTKEYLDKVIEYCQKHLAGEDKGWEKQHLEMDRRHLSKFLKAVKYLKVGHLYTKVYIELMKNAFGQQTNLQLRAKL